MRSQFADKFNHDEDALKYDDNVLDETDPIRAGYNELINWVVAEASTNNNSVVLDLGSGTGNLTKHLKHFKELVCVDISKEMLLIAKDKFASFNNIIWIKEDILEFIFESRKTFDIIVSTYAIHHLTEAEKGLLLKEVVRSLNPNSKAVFGDLMFENEKKKEQFMKNCLHNGRKKLIDEIKDEFFWNVEATIKVLQGLGFQVITKQFSELSWGISATNTI
ncbi:MAG: class I SAM-dependent methyltransferase [Ignavibacteria bacterium]|nr:class I SAM-dependent methyltransferase [Ignavibacteria bacterium]